MEGVDLVIPGFYLMEAIPAMMHLPSFLYSLPKKLRIGSAIGACYFYMLTEEGAKSASDCFAKTMTKAQEQQKMTDVEVAGLMANLIGGGVDTTSSTMLSCILAMACFPDVQAKAQTEMDDIVGQDRSPTWEDIDEGRLPYLTVLAKEVLRWRTVTVLAGIPHANTQAVTYRGYKFPANTNFTGNMWAIHRNPRDFSNPDEFRPERFLNGLENPYPNARGSNPFGWGRRQCSGQPLAEQGLLFSLGRLIWSFKIEPGLDNQVINSFFIVHFRIYNPFSQLTNSFCFLQGKPVKLDIFAYTKSENTRPEAFKARFTPRSETIHRLILDEAAQARAALRVYDGETQITMEDAAPNPAFV